MSPNSIPNHGGDPVCSENAEWFERSKADADGRDT
eukprot:CAMPEP_0178665750 /NCGR_PEP_ID=MMETSP0698-20121128/30121_1 /TAXON_ID=265572 /ORGANISM="Extubocellulus spinifer, Strain CCMP396" /LENGTH=34 /DNA_ID= /DNA_START= /DNA_END= /DNA_ORIENTATION=